MRRLSLLLVLIAVIAAACGRKSGAPVRVVIPKGAAFREATDSLANHGLVGSPRLFRAYARLIRRDRRIRAGTYILQRGASWNEIITALSTGRGLVHTVRVVEGFRIETIGNVLATQLTVPVESVYVAVTDSALRHRLDVPTTTIEGYLFPDTYLFGDRTSARAAVERMVERFESVWQPEWDERLRALAMSRHDIMTLASIIEKEARLPDERPVIAAVYHNRLRIGMPLQADPTVQYATGKYGQRVLLKDLEHASRYNTYRYPGLPPGPICSPGAASIHAALFPADVPYLYFVAHPDGHHEFRTTFEGHTKARRDIRQRSGRRTRASPR